jgi:hypothetical protein
MRFAGSVLSILPEMFECSYGFAFCPVAVYSMFPCSCRPLSVVFITCNERSLSRPTGGQMSGHGHLVTWFDLCDGLCMPL